MNFNEREIIELEYKKKIYMDATKRGDCEHNRPMSLLLHVIFGNKYIFKGF